MFRPQSLPLRPSGAPVSSLKFSVSHQYATQHHLCIALVWSALYGAVWSLALLFRGRLIEPDSRCGTEKERVRFALIVANCLRVPSQVN